MKLELFKSLWGHHGTLLDAIDEAHEAGFRGLEAMVPHAADERQEFIDALETDQMDLIAEVCTCTPPGLYVPEPGKSPAAHLHSLEQGIIRSLEAYPRFINTMAGCDSWSPMEALDFFTGVLDLEQKYNIAISCETHRGRYTYSPWLTRDLLRNLPDLKITCDFSHWCVVSERMILDEDPALLKLVARHAFHIQARIGYAQGPQVPDPRAPEYHSSLVSHEQWWDTVWASMDARGVEVTTLTPEFGPDGYLHCAPFTQTPVADLWTINRWTALRQQSRFNRRHFREPESIAS